MSSEPGRGMVLLQRTDLVSRDVEMIASLMRDAYAEHRPRFRFSDPAMVEAKNTSVAVGPLGAGSMYWRGMEYAADDSRANGILYGEVTVRGGVTLTSGDDEMSFGPGDVFPGSPVRPVRGRHGRERIDGAPAPLTGGR